MEDEDEDEDEDKSTLRLSKRVLERVNKKLAALKGT